MRTLVLGDYGTLVGTPEKPGKVQWLREREINVEGVQIISLKEDLFPINLVTYQDKILALLDAIPDLERVSVALLCWPLLTQKDDTGKNVDVAASTFLDADLFCYALAICSALQKVYDATGVDVDISYHPMLTVPRLLVEAGIINRGINLSYEMRKKEEFGYLLKAHEIKDVGIAIENEPTTSDSNANLIHAGNRLWSEAVHKLPSEWGITADIQHLAMALHWLQRDSFSDLPESLRLFIPHFHSHLYNEDEMGFGFNSEEIEETIKNLGSWERQFEALEGVGNNITFHVSQMTDPLRHISAPVDFQNPIMDWSRILKLMKDFDYEFFWDVWYAVEIDGGHLYPNGYTQDLEALQYLQKYFE